MLPARTGFGKPDFFSNGGKPAREPAALTLGFTSQILAATRPAKQGKTALQSGQHLTRRHRPAINKNRNGPGSGR